MKQKLQPLLFAFLWIIQWPLSAPADETPPPLRALLVTGGCCHDYDTQKDLIAKGLQLRAHIDVTVVRQGGASTDAKIPLYESPDWSKGFDIVIHDECFADVKDRAWVDNILKPHREGLPGVVIHCAMHCYRDGREDWFQFCGVTSHRHGAHYPHEVLNRDAAHPIMRGWGPGWFNPAGELYWIEKVWPTAHPLASAKNRERGTDEVCVWTNEFGEKKTRVFGTTLGHHNETVSDPKFLDLLTRGVLWACGKDDSLTVTGLDSAGLSKSYLKTQKPAEPEWVPVNLAINKPGTASSVQDGNDIRNAFDDRSGSRWCANGGSFPQWLQVDLGQVTHLTGCRIDWENRNAPYRYTIEGSDDGKAWRGLVDQSKNDSEVNATHEFDDRARYLRVNCLAARPGQWASLWELQVFGDEKIKVDPVAMKAETERSKLADLKISDAFEATLFAAPPAVSYPTFVAAAPDGTVYVSVDKNGSLDRQLKRGSVLRLRDIDGDGRADESKYFVADVDSPRGLVWDHDRLYLMHPPHLSAFIDRDGDGIADEQQVLVKNIAFGFKDRPADHTSNGVTLGIDGWLYLAIGDFGFMEAEGIDGRRLQLRGGGVVRVRPDGTGLELYSSGTRNILEVAVDPLLNGFTRDNTNDGGGWDIRLHHFTGLEDHGYPRLYMNFNEEIIQPLADYGGGSGCGALFLDEPGFPDGYAPAAYTADWGRSMVYRHRMTPHGATFQPDQTEFAGLTRVTDLDVDAGSQVFIASWKGATFTYAGEDVGSLIRVRPKGYQPEPLPDFEKASSAELVALLKSPSHRRRLEAQRALLRRGIDAAAAGQLKTVALDTTNKLSSRVAALFTLKQASAAQRARTMTAQGRANRRQPMNAALGQVPGEAESPAGAEQRFAAGGFDVSVSLKEVLKAAFLDDTLRPFAVRAAADLSNDLDPALLPFITASVTENSDPRSRLELAVAVARFGDATSAKSITPLLSDADAVVRHTAIQSLIKLKANAVCFEIVDQRDASEAARTGALRVLQGIHETRVVDGLIERLGREADPSKRRGLLIALCRLHFVEGEWKGNSWGTRPDTRGPYFQPEPWAESDRIAAVLLSELERSDSDGAQFLAVQLARHRIELKDGLKTLLARADTDARFVPALVSAIYRSGSLPNEALPVVSRVATAEGSPPDLRGQAVVALLKSSSSEAFQAAVSGLERAGQQRQDIPEAVNLFRDPGTLNRHAKALLALATSDRSNAWLDGGLLLLAEERGKNRKDNRAEEVDAALVQVWSRPARRLTLLKSAEQFNTRTQEALIQNGLSDADPQVIAQARKLADAWKITTAAPTGPKLSTMKPEQIIAAVLKKSGDAARGEGVFAKLNCNKCHTVKPDEPIRGPYLPNVAKTYKREQLAESILLPSKTLAQGFVTSVFILNDGKSLVGFVTNEAADEVTIRNAEGNELKIKVEDIEERAKQPISVMPEGLAKDITLDDFAALITYLESLASRATK